MKKTQLAFPAGLLLLAGALSLHAASGTWTNDASGTWSDTTQWLGGTVADASGFTADFSTINLTANRTVTLDAAHTLTTLKFGDIIPDFNWTLSGANTLTLAGTTPTINVLNQNTTISSVIAGTAGLTKAGKGTLTLGGATDTFTGGLKDNAGTLTLDYNASGSPSSTLVPSQALTLSGGTLNLNGNAGTASSQAFAGVTLNPGLSIISAAPASGANNPTVTLGAWTANRGALVRFIGPATIGAGNASVPATATITTTTVGSGAASFGILLGEGPAVANATAAFGTVGLYDWASTSLASGAAGTSPYTIIGGSQVTAFYSTAWAANANVDVTSAITIGNNSYAPSIRFNTPGAPNLASGGGGNLTFGGVLVTPNMGAVNASITGNGTWQVVRITNPAGQQAGTIWQNNTLGYFTMTPVISDGRDAGDANNIITAGDGTIFFTSGSTYTGPTIVGGGNLVISANSALGAIGTGTAVQLNGGTLFANGTFALNNAGSTPRRGITLLGNGGGLAAVAGSTLTVDGQVGSAAGTGPLVIGLPASAANGNVAGLLPGSGSIANGQTVDTANTTPVFGTGTVALTFPSGTSGNFQTGGTLITGGATLNINSQYALGGGNQGPTIFNGGTLQYNSTLATGAAGAAQDITGQPVTFTGNATIDVNGNAITYAGSIGNGGSGSLTLKSTAPNGIFTLSAANNYAGGTTISSGTLKVNNTTGSGTGSGNVTIASGGTLGGNGIISGAVTNLSGGQIAPGNNGVGTNTVGALTMNSGSLYNFEFTATANDQTVVSSSGGLTINGGACNLYQPGGTVAYTATGTYNLIQYSGAIGGSGLDSSWTTASAGNPHIANPQAGLAYAFGTSGGYLTLTIMTAGVVAVWTNDADGNWEDGTQWSSNPSFPHSAGDAATFGVGSALRTVTLNANESVGGLFLTNANSFVIANGGHTLTLDNSGGGVNVTVSAGTANVIQTPLALNDNAQVNVLGGESLAFAGVISNSAGVTKTLAFNGAGTNVLAAANSYGPAAGSIGTTLSGGGILQVANNAALGAGDLSITGSSTLQAGAAGLSVGNNLSTGSGTTTTVDDNGNALTLGGVISGSGALAKIGGGTLALVGNNTYTGNTTVTAGTLSIGSPLNVSGTPNIILNGGDLLGSGTFSLNNNIGIGLAAGSANTIAWIDAAGGQSFTINGTIASAGNIGVNSLTVNANGGTGTVTLGGANTFTGNTTISNGVLQIAQAMALANSTLEYDAGTLLFDPAITATTFGGLSGTNLTGIGLTNLSGAALTLTVGNNNSTTAYYGGLSGSGGLGKVGTGILTLSNATYGGNTVVYAGGLNLNAPANLTGHLDISAQYGVANVAINGSSLTSPNGIYITSPSGSTGTIYGNPANLTITNGAQVTANADGAGRALSYGSGNGRPGGNGSLTVGAVGDTTTLVTANGALDMFYTSGGSAVGNFSVNLNGGTLAVDNIQESSYGNQTGTFKFNGGILKALAGDGSVNFFPATPAQLTAVVNGGAIIDDGGFSITVAKGLTHGTGSPDGGLVKLGAGTLTLDAANTYTGNTTISNGVLALGTAGSIAASQSIILNSNATFDVSALGGYVLGSGQTLSNSSTTATLSGNFNTGLGTVSLIYSNGIPSFTVTNGTLTVPATTTFKVNNTGVALAVGSYKLVSTNLNGSGLVDGSTLPAVTVAGNGLAGGAGTPVLQINNGELYLVVPSGVNTTPGTLSLSQVGNVLSLSWPADHTGWRLLVQTNNLAAGVSSNTNDWTTVTGSAGIDSTNITINPALPSEFYRLVYP